MHSEGALSQDLIASFIRVWKDKHEAKEYNLAQPVETEAFLEAAISLLRHLAHTRGKATIYTVSEKERISAVYVHIVQ